MPGPLTGLRVLDLSRVLAGPFCTQMLGDLGAEVIKVERPGGGDDSRRFGPPFLTDDDSRPTDMSGYFAGVNRNKRSLALDITRPEGQAVLRRLLAGCDVLMENFKTGNLAKYGLSYADLKDDFPRLVYCSLTGFGQSGPYAHRPGYDFLAQAMGGMMSLTGDPQGDPVRVGIGNADQITGMYAAIAILAAVRHRDQTGRGQHIDVNLLDSQVAWMSYEAQNYLMSGREPVRVGNAHPNIVPYEAYGASDGHLVLAVGNDAQFRRFVTFAGHPELADDPRFRTNADRLAHRSEMTKLLREIFVRHPRAHWLEGLEAIGVPCGPVNAVPEVFADPHVQARGTVIAAPHPDGGDRTLPMVANPIRLSETPAEVRRPPPRLGADGDAVLREAGFSDDHIAALKASGVL